MGRTPDPTRSSAQRRANACRDERGASVVSLTLGVLVFFIMLFTAVQVLFLLHLSSVVNSVAYDSARIVARSGSSADAAARSEATSHARSLLSGVNEVQIDFAGSTAESVVVTITASPPTFVGTSFGIPILGDVSRSATLRVEQPVLFSP